MLHHAGHLQKTMRKALHARHEMHDRQGNEFMETNVKSVIVFHCFLFACNLFGTSGDTDEAHPYSDIVNIVLEKSLADSKEWFSADIVRTSLKQDFNFDEYIQVWEFAGTVSMHSTTVHVLCRGYNLDMILM
jgi:hypothetical protein